MAGGALLAYQTLVAMGFAGATRYRVPWDFLLALAAARGDLVAGRPEAARVRVVHVHRIRGIGGSERHLLTLLPALREHGIEPRVPRARRPGLGGRAVLRRARSGVGAAASARATSTSGWRARVRREIARLAPAIVHTHLVHGDVYGAYGAGSAALVSTKHNDDRFRRGPFRFVERAVTRKASRVIAITESLKRFCVDEVGLPAAKVEVVHYGLDALPEPWGDSPEVPLPDGARVLLAVSRLEEQKGVDVAVRALARVREVEPRAVLVVLGEGPERPRLAGDGVYLPGPGRRRGGLVPAGGAARPPGALGGLRARACSRRCSPGSRWSPRGSARSRSSSSTARPGCSFRRTTRTRSPRRCSRCSATRAGGAWARPAWRGRRRSSRSRRWPSGPPAVYAGSGLPVSPSAAS